MLYFNSCPRCTTGTIEFTNDMWGKYLSCLMCGYAIHSKSIRPDGPASEVEPVTESFSLVGAAVSALADDVDADAEDDDDDLDLFGDLDDGEDAESPARVAFG